MIEDEYLLRYLMGFLTLEEQHTVSNLCKRMKSLIVMPKHYGKIKHFEELTKQYTVRYLVDCVQTYTQAYILYNNIPPIMRDYYITSLQDRHTKKLFRNIMYRESLQEPKAKLLRVR